MHCYRCGAEDHSTKVCRLSGRVCFNCQEEGHARSACPKPRGRKCGGCGEKGHFSAKCPTRVEWTCKNCLERGHGHWECLKPRGYSKMECRCCHEVGHTVDFCTKTEKWFCSNCHESGHLQERCPKPRDYLKRICRNCGEVGHLLSACPHAICFKCGETGHIARTCANPNPRTGICYQCGSESHIETHCPLTKSGTKPDHTKKTFETETPKDNRAHEDNQSSTGRPDCRRESKGNVPNATELYREAALASSLGDHETVVQLLTEAIALNPKLSMCYARRGLAHASLKNHAAALSDFQHASSMPAHEDISMVEVYIYMARCRFHLGSRSSALLAVRAALELQQDNLQAKALRKCLLTLEGHIEDYNSARKRNHWRKARAAYESCLDIYEAQDCPSSVEVRCWGIELRVAESDWEGALRAIDPLLQRETKSTEVMIIRALVLFLTGKLPQALEQIITVLKTDPDNETAKAIRSRIKTVARLKEEGDTLYKDGEWKEAIARWDTALESVYENENEGRGGLLRSILLSNRAAAKLQLKEFDKSLRDVDDALKLDSTLWSAFLTRARIYAALEMYDLACENFRAVLQHAAASNVKDLDGFRAELEKTETIAARERDKEKDYYTILGISQGCTLLEIRKAYRVQSLKHHPDKGGIEEIFKLISKAYSVLSDEDSRRDYDVRRSERTAQRQNPYSDDSYSYSDDDGY